MSSKLSRQQVNQLSTRDTTISLLEGTLDRCTLELQKCNKGIQRKNRYIEALLFEISKLHDFITVSQQDTNWEQYETNIFKQLILKKGFTPCSVCSRRKVTEESGFKYCYKCDPENVKNKKDAVVDPFMCVDCAAKGDDVSITVTKDGISRCAFCTKVFRATLT